MKVFVTGATGFIGSAVATAFARSGHETYGLVRTPGKERLLEAAEVVPVYGTMEEPDAWRPAAERCSVLVHCAVEYSEKSWDLHRAALGALRDAGRDRIGRVLLATSGVWVCSAYWMTPSLSITKAERAEGSPMPAIPGKTTS